MRTKANVLKYLANRVSAGRLLRAVSQATPLRSVPLGGPAMAAGAAPTAGSVRVHVAESAARAR
jgi:hypothetical protein